MKSYLRYGHAQAFGVVASPACHICTDGEQATLFTGALESVHAWNVRQGTLVRFRPLSCHARRSLVSATRSMFSCMLHFHLACCAARTLRVLVPLEAPACQQTRTQHM